MKDYSFVLFMTCSLSKDIQCHAWPCRFFLFGSHQFRHHAPCSLSSQSGDCQWPLSSPWRVCVGMYGLAYFINPEEHQMHANVPALKTTHTREKCRLPWCCTTRSLSKGIQHYKKNIKLFTQLADHQNQTEGKSGLHGHSDKSLHGHLYNRKIVITHRSRVWDLSFRNDTSVQVSVRTFDRSTLGIWSKKKKKEKRSHCQQTTQLHSTLLIPKFFLSLLSGTIYAPWTEVRWCRFTVNIIPRPDRVWCGHCRL